MRIRLTKAASKDLLEIYEFIAEKEGTLRADKITEYLKRSLESLSSFPHRGTYCIETKGESKLAYRQTVCRSYRIVYRIDQEDVFIVLIAHVRRDLRPLLLRRLSAAE